MSDTALPSPIVCACGEQRLPELLGKEWLIANRLGAYASSTVVGCNTRRYHGLLVGATRPPVGRVCALSTVAEKLIDESGSTYDLATFEFAGTFSPRGVVHLVEFSNDVAPRFVLRAGKLELTKEIVLSDSANAVAIRYTLRGGRGRLEVQPFVAMRDFHQLRKVHDPHQMTFERCPDGAMVRDLNRSLPALYLISPDGDFRDDAQWWYRFRYRADFARGMDSFEDLYAPGCFRFTLRDGCSCQITASLDTPVSLDFAAMLERRRKRLAEPAASLPDSADETQRRLAAATDTFLVRRDRPKGRALATILAGYHWFADWGRDAFVALPGLLLTTGRFAQAREVFRTFADRLDGGMIPSRFDDYSEAAHYNSIDGSLWFIIAAERYIAATGDAAFWREVLGPAACAILSAYREGTRFDIHSDADGLLTGGSPHTQLTWMDAALGEEVITPRHGKAVEVNALWHSAHRILAKRYAGVDDELAERFAGWAALIAPAFARAFWNDSSKCLYDCINAAGPDESFRPNQIFAVSLPHSPLSHDRQAAVVDAVRDSLLTPMGLRTLCPDDPRYRPRYGGSWESRDRSYHQGTVWAWLIGPFIEAYLKVHAATPAAVAQARQWLRPFDDHLRQAGLGFISEIFDGDAPHRPSGCIAQAWSVAEVLRAKELIDEAERVQ